MPTPPPIVSVPGVDAAALAQAAYGDPPPPNWTFEQTYLGTSGTTSVSIYYNQPLNVAAVSFRGSANKTNYQSDFSDGGSKAWLDLNNNQPGVIAGAVANVVTYLNSNLPNARVITVGDSLAGGQAQAFGTIFQVPVYSFESLPIPQSALDTINIDYGSVANAFSQYAAAGLVHNTLHKDGDLATALFGPSGIFGSGGPFTASVYLPETNTTVLDNGPASIAESIAIDQLMANPINPAAIALLSVSGFLTHWIDTDVSDIKSGDGFTTTTTPQTALVDANGQVINSALQDSTVTLNGSIPSASASSGPEVTVTTGASTADTQIITESQNGVSQGNWEGVTGGTGAIYNATALGDTKIFDISGGNTLSTGATSGVVLFATSNDGVNLNAVGAIAQVMPNSLNVNVENWLSGDTTDVYNNSQVNIINNNATVNAQGEDDIELLGTGATVGASNSLVTVDSGSSISDTINGLLGTGATATGQEAGIVIDQGSAATINGQNRIVVDGTGVTINGNGAGGSSISIPDGMSATVTGNDVDIFAGTNATINVTGSGDELIGADGDSISFNGSSDRAEADDSTIDFAPGGTGDEFFGSDDSTYGGAYGGPDAYGAGYGYYGYYGFSNKKAASGTSVGKIASYDASQGDEAGAVAAQTARLTTAAAVNGPATAGAAPSIDGPKWSSATITWSLAQGVASSGTPFSGPIGSQYEAMLAQAFQVWGQAAGLTFQEVSDSPAADIRVGWGAFDAQNSGVMGYTVSKAKEGAFSPNATINLEDPSENALTTDANGQAAYSGTNTELFQLMLHEIGHALGLGESSDPNSIMNSVMSSSNRGLDAADISAIQDLYGVGSSTSPATLTTGGEGKLPSQDLEAQAARLIEAMAIFNPTPGSVITSAPQTMAQAMQQLSLAVGAPSPVAMH